MKKLILQHFMPCHSKLIHFYVGSLLISQLPPLLPVILNDEQKMDWYLKREEPYRDVPDCKAQEFIMVLWLELVFNVVQPDTRENFTKWSLCSWEQILSAIFHLLQRFQPGKPLLSKRLLQQVLPGSFSQAHQQPSGEFLTHDHRLLCSPVVM